MVRPKRDIRAAGLSRGGKSARGGGRGAGGIVGPEFRPDGSSMEAGRVARGRSNVSKRDRVNPDDVAVSCWCGQAVVWVRADQIGTTTDTCGRSGCHPPSMKGA